MNEWSVRLRGRQSDLEDLTELALPDYSVEEENGDYYLRSTHFSSLANADDVRACAEGFLEKVRAAAAVYELAAFKAVDVDVVTRVKPDGTSEHSGQFTAAAVIVAAPDDRSQRFAEVRDLFALAVQDKGVADALHFFLEPSWINLYKAFEIVKDDVSGEQGIVDKGWATMRAIKRFRRTAQSRAALGDDARHASTKYTPPRKPMDSSEATSFVRSLLLRWFRSKL